MYIRLLYCYQYNLIDQAGYKSQQPVGHIVVSQYPASDVSV